MRLGLGMRLHTSIVAGGGGGGGFDPTTLSLTGYWKASYAGVPWTPTATAGSSGSNGNLTADGTAPDTGTSVNGLTPATFNGTTQGFQAGSASTFVNGGTSVFSVVGLFYADASTAAATDFYDDPTLFGDVSGNWGLVFTASGVRAGKYTSSSQQTTHIAQATGAWFLAAMTYDGTDIVCYVNSTTSTKTVVGTPGALSGNLKIGKNYTGAKLLQGRALELMTAQSVLSGSDIANIRSYFNTTYGLSL